MSPIVSLGLRRLTSYHAGRHVGIEFLRRDVLRRRETERLFVRQRVDAVCLVLGVMEALKPGKDERHASTEEVPR